VGNLLFPVLALPSFVCDFSFLLKRQVSAPKGAPTVVVPFFFSKFGYRCLVTLLGGEIYASSFRSFGLRSLPPFLGGIGTAC